MGVSGKLRRSWKRHRWDSGGLHEGKRGNWTGEGDLGFPVPWAVSPQPRGAVAVMMPKTRVSDPPEDATGLSDAPRPAREPPGP